MGTGVGPALLVLKLPEPGRPDRVRADRKLLRTVITILKKDPG